MEQDANKLNVLFALQEECLHNLKKAESNFKKTPKNRMKQPYLETRLESLEELYNTFKEGHKSIVSETLSNQQYPYFVEEIYECFEEIYFDYKSLISEALPPLVSKSQASAAIKHPQESDHSEVTPPQIILPTFSGNYEEWKTFYDIFLSSIHNNKHITSVQKLDYLKSNLSGEALNLLQNFLTTDVNYEDVWEQLVRWYDNKRYTSNAVLTKLFSLKKLHIESGEGIKQLLDTTSTCLKSLENIGINTSTWDIIIVFLVVSKLDPESIDQWEQRLNTMSSSELPTWKQLNDYLDSRLRFLEMIEPIEMYLKSDVKHMPKHIMFHENNLIEKKPRNNSVTCAMCNENHFLYQCNQYGLLTLNKRQEFVQNNNLCFNCLSSTHAALRCEQSTSCSECGQPHHTTLHIEQEHRGVYTHQISTQVSEIEDTSSSPSRGDLHITTTFSGRQLQHNEVLVTTATVKVVYQLIAHQLLKCF
jgi:hypothetical protein